MNDLRLEAKDIVQDQNGLVGILRTSDIGLQAVQGDVFALTVIVLCRCRRDAEEI